MDTRAGSDVNHSTPQPQANCFCGKCDITTSVQAVFRTYNRQTSSSLAAMQYWLSLIPRFRGKNHPFTWNLVNLSIFTLLAYIRTSGAVFVDFENCLSPNIIHSTSQNQSLLQFTPYHVWASFNDSAPSHTLNITVYGNISGIATNESRPAWNDPRWQNDNITLGKIVDEDQSNNHWSTFFARFNVLDYTPYDAPASRFCNSTIHQQCPLIPAFNLTGDKYVEIPMHRAWRQS